LASSTMNSADEVANFGRNVHFRPSAYLVPRTEEDVLEILAEHRGKKIRVIGRLHSWSEAPRADEVLIDSRHLNHVHVERDKDGLVASIGAGCQVKRVLEELERQADATLPSMGLITEQTIAGAIATGTHGSGRHSMSHYITEVRLAAYDPETGEPAIRVVRDGLHLLAARCSVGCMGVVLSVKIRCRASYMVEEHIQDYKSLESVLAQEAEFPLQQFFIIPWSWQFLVQHRREVHMPRSWAASLYRAYWLLGVDVMLHLWICFMARRLRSARLVHFFFRRFFPHTILYRCRVIDRSPAMLTMEHELFRHIAIEIFVDRTRLAEAVRFMRELLACFDSSDANLNEPWRERLDRIGLLDVLRERAGTYTHHYPICVRRVLPDDTLISMSSGDSDAWYAMSIISYARPNERESFLAFARFMAESMAVLFGARLHWGKVFPLGAAAVAAMYPRLADFQQVCAAFDPDQVFANRWAASALLSGTTRDAVLAEAPQ